MKVICGMSTVAQYFFLFVIKISDKFSINHRVLMVDGTTRKIAPCIFIRYKSLNIEIKYVTSIADWANFKKEHL